MIEEFFARHEKVILQFSAGKDSAACLWLLQPWWNKLVVVWCNQGNPYPETIAYMEKIKGLVPHFEIVQGEQKTWVRERGYPVDIIPLLNTDYGRAIAVQDNLKLQPFWECCSHNFWEPMAKFVEEKGFTGVIRGQRLEEALKSPVRSGNVIEGVEYFFPLETWTEGEVLEYLGDRVPDSYKRGLKSSLDCINCTAYLKESSGRLEDLKETSPAVYENVKAVHGYLNYELQSYIKLLEV